MLQTRAPTRKKFGPTVTSFESRPMTFHVTGGGRVGGEAAGGGIVLIVRFAWPAANEGARQTVISVQRAPTQAIAADDLTVGRTTASWEGRFPPRSNTSASQAG